LGFFFFLGLGFNENWLKEETVALGMNTRSFSSLSASSLPLMNDFCCCSLNFYSARF